MTTTNWLIRVRENILNTLLRTNPAATLNTIEGSPERDLIDGSLAAEIKKTLNHLKSLAVSADNQTVNYGLLQRDPAYQDYRVLTEQLGTFNIESLESPQEKLAFWINLYNALIIDAVIQENIQDSVTESWLGVLSFFQKAAYWVNGSRFSLSDIEHGVLRGNRGFPYFPGSHFGASDPRLKAVVETVDPRIHFALNCASKSCPPINFYTPENLDSQLDLAARNFINQDLILKKDQQRISISMIFRWYQVDFGGRDGMFSFLEKYLVDPLDSQWIQNNRTAVQLDFHPYDWGLNKS
ncbi:MAG: DUF547 domain-containing protein [Chloroflexi bacterium]|nr:DUF547 domain-containing protein [Chloroflexota bacterium]